MPEYKQKITFSRTFVIQADDAAEANKKLEDLVDEVEFAGELDVEWGYYEFEDEEPPESDDETKEEPS